MIPVSLCCGRLICLRDPARKRAERAGDAVKIRYFRCLNGWVAQRSRLQISSKMRSAFYAKIKDFERHSYPLSTKILQYVWQYARKHGCSLRVPSAQSFANDTRQKAKAFVLAIHRSDTLANRRVILDAAKAVALTQSEALR
jgi:hypothetical protein